MRLSFSSQSRSESDTLMLIQTANSSDHDASDVATKVVLSVILQSHQNANCFTGYPQDRHRADFEELAQLLIVLSRMPVHILYPLWQLIFFS